MLGESENWMGSPNTRHKNECTKVEVSEGTRNPRVCFLLKSCESLYTCPLAPFYTETKGLLHFEITLESKEYS
jgi:hypothetical protein